MTTPGNRPQNYDRAAAEQHYGFAYGHGVTGAFEPYGTATPAQPQFPPVQNLVGQQMAAGQEEEQDAADRDRRARNAALQSRVRTAAEHREEHLRIAELDEVVRYASGLLMNRGVVAPMREEVIVGNPTAWKPKTRPLDLFHVLELQAGGYPERVLLAPQIGSLVTEHRFVPSKDFAHNFGLTEDVRKHRSARQTRKLHVDSTQTVIDAGRATVGTPLERISHLRTGLARIAGDVVRGRPLQPSPASSSALDEARRVRSQRRDDYLLGPNANTTRDRYGYRQRRPSDDPYR